MISLENTHTIGSDGRYVQRVTRDELADIYDRLGLEPKRPPYFEAGDYWSVGTESCPYCRRVGTREHETGCPNV